MILPGIAGERETCSLCRYWKQIAGEDSLGECRRFPPMLATDGCVRDGNGIWPDTSADDWCGEYRSAVKNGEGEK